MHRGGNGTQIGVTTEGLVRRVDDETLELLDLPHHDLGALLRAEGARWRAVVAGAACRGRRRPEDLTPTIPVGTGAAVWGIGTNYRSTLAARSGQEPASPILYLRATSSLAASGSSTAIPPGVQQLDYEGELAAIIQSPAWQLAPDEGWAAVGLVGPANDLTARDVMRRTENPTLAKSFPGACPLGWVLADARELPDRDDLAIRTLVNGAVAQQDWTSGMLRPVGDVVAELSHHTALQPGDVVLTGSPAGSGQERSEFLGGGDVIEVHLHDLPPLRTTVARAVTATPDPSSAY